MRIRSNPLQFVDFLFILLLTFISLFILTLLLINPVAKKSEVKQKAEFLIILEWEDGNASDVDLWARDPAGNIVSFRAKQAGTMHLDKDDMGRRTDTYHNKEGVSSIVAINQEIITIRGIPAGEFVINLHLYRLEGTVEELNPITIQVIKLNPFNKAFEGTIKFEKWGQEVTVTRFTVNADGDIIELDDTPERFINIPADFGTGAHGEGNPTQN